MTFVDYIKSDLFLLGVISGIVASVLYYSFARLIKLLIISLSKFSLFNVWIKSKVKYVFDNQDKAIKQMYNDAKKSKKIYGFSGSGYTFTEPKCKLHELLKSDRDMRFLIYDPKSMVAQKRNDELNKLDVRAYINQIETGAERFEESNAKFAFHRELSRIRFYIFDDVIYLGFRLKKKYSIRDAQIFRIEKGSDLYQSFCEQFDDLWEKYNT